MPPGDGGALLTGPSLCRTDTTRVEFTVPLRENWALPFFAIQVAAVTYFLRPNLQPRSEVSSYSASCAFQSSSFASEASGNGRRALFSFHGQFSA